MIERKYRESYKRVQKKLDKLSLLELELQKRLNQIRLKKQEIKDSCNHDYILYIGKQYKFDTQNDFAVCLCCEKTFKIINKHRIDKKKNRIIDISNIVEDKNLEFFVNEPNVNIYTGVAKRKLNKLINSEIPIEFDEIITEIRKEVMVLNDILDKRIKLSEDEIKKLMKKFE